MGGQQRLGEHVVEREHAEEGDDHSFVDGGPTPCAPPEAFIPLYEQTIATIAPNRVVFSTEPQRSVTDALAKRVAKKPPSGWP